MIRERPGGYMGQMLFADLSAGTLHNEVPSESLLREFIGGYGLAARILYERTPAMADPLGPENILAFAAGGLTGTPAIMANRFIVAGRSPLTGGWGDANAGGSFGPKLKSAGYDAVFVRGQSEMPCYIFVESGVAQILDATSLWGLTTSETEAAFRQTHGDDIEIACIGPAGEKLSLISAVMTDGTRAAARSGLGAVMGSKRLKAVVAKGDKTPAVAAPDRVEELRKLYLPGFSAEGSAGPVLGAMGTAAFTPMLLEIGRTPIKNFAGTFPADCPDPSKIGGEAFDAFKIKRYACWRCNQACGAEMEWTHDGKQRHGHRPEYETVAACGTYIGIHDDPISILEMNRRCNEAGIDTISAGACIAFAMECQERGLLEDVGFSDPTLVWENAERAIALLDQIIAREGLGGLLADGTVRAAEKIGGGSSALAMQAGGQELPAHDPRQAHGFGLMYKISPTPGRHTQGGAGYENLTDRDIEHLGLGGLEKTAEGNARAYRVLTAWQNTLNAAGFCHFGAMSMDRLYVPRFIEAVTGWHFSMEECIECGERIETIRHLFGLKHGYNPLDVEIAPRALGRPPLKEGPNAHSEVFPEALEKAYFDEMGWDHVTARPSWERLVELRLDALIAEET